jgi:glutamine phosphoribosylpyrophosphate amidotransferase
MMEVVHHFLVKEDEIHHEKPDIATVLRKATSLFDGGYNFGGIVGNGYSFVMRDANGIRPLTIIYTTTLSLPQVKEPPSEPLLMLGRTRFLN